MNMRPYNMETLTPRVLHELVETGMINLKYSTNCHYDVSMGSAKIFPISDLIAKYHSLGLVPVEEPEVGTSRQTELDTSSESEFGTSKVCDLESIGYYSNSPYIADDNNSAPGRRKRVQDGYESSSEKPGTDRELTASVTPNKKRWAKLKEMKNRVINTFQIKKMREFAEVFTKHIIATQTTTDIGGEEVIVNIIPSGIVAGTNSSYIDATAVYTPENYEETFDYYERITENRRYYFQAMYSIGDMLMAGELEGDSEDWKQYILRSDEEVRAWRKKCNRSNDIFEKTGRVMEYDDTKYRRFVLSTRKWFSRCCPCQ